MFNEAVGIKLRKLANKMARTLRGDCTLVDLKTLIVSLRTAFKREVRWWERCNLCSGHFEDNTGFNFQIGLSPPSYSRYIGAAVEPPRSSVLVRSLNRDDGGPETVCISPLDDFALYKANMERLPALIGVASTVLSNPDTPTPFHVSIFYASVIEFLRELKAVFSDHWPILPRV